MKKKLALLLYRYFPYGGLQKDFMGVVKELLIRGHELRVYVRTWEGPIPNNLKVIQLGEKGFSNYSKNKNYSKSVKDFYEEFSPDIVFGFNKTPGLDLYFAADTCFANQSQYKHPLQKYTRRFRQSIHYEKEVFSRSSATKILLLNDNQRSDFLKNYSTQSERMTIIPPGIDDNWNNNKSINIKEILGIPAEDKIMLFVGSDFYRKGLDRAIMGLSYLLERNKPATLIVIGDDRKEPYRKILKTDPLVKKVHFLGPRDDVASFMKSSDLLIHPAREEAAGNIIIEAIVSGLPSMVTEAVGFSTEVLKHESGEVLRGDFNQDKFNLKLDEILSDKRLSSIKNSISELSDCDYFFSRFSYIADYIETQF